MVFKSMITLIILKVKKCMEMLRGKYFKKLMDMSFKLGEAALFKKLHFYKKRH